MKLIWFQAFTSVVSCGSFLAASEELYTSQANISKYISLLEKELDVVLFDRRSRHATLTDAGKKVFQYADRMVKEYRALQHFISEKDNKKTSNIKIVSVPIVHLYGLAESLMDYAKSGSDVQLEMTETDLNGVLYALENEENTIGILRSCALQLLPSSNQWHSAPFIYDELVLLCHRDHPLSALDSVSLVDCINENLLVLNTASLEYKLVLMSYGIPAERYTPSIKCGSFVTLRKYVESNIGVSMLTRSMATQLCNEGNLVMRDFIEKPTFSLTIVAKDRALLESMSSLLQAMKSRLVDTNV